MSSSRPSLHDCTLDIRLPILSHITAAQSAEKIASHAAATPGLDHSEAYTGSSVLILLTVTPPQGVAIDTSQSFIHHAADPHVFLVPPSSSGLSPASPSPSPSTRPGATRLPLLAESAWRPAARPGTAVKAIWVLLVTPEDRASSHRTGPHDLFVILRERLSPGPQKNSPVWATIDRASRLFSRSSALRASKQLLIVSPVDISCTVSSVSGSLDRPIVSVLVKNATSDAVVTLVPPVFNLSSSRRVSRRASVTLVESHPAVEALHSLYEAVPLFTTDFPFTNKVPSSASTRSPKSHLIPLEDRGDVVKLHPQETFNFAFRLERRMEGSSRKEDVQHMGGMLKPDEAVQTGVMLSWSCTRSKDAPVPFQSRPKRATERMLASNRHNTVSVNTPVEWVPVALLHGILVSLTGPPVLAVGHETFVNIGIVNRLGIKIRGARLCLQDGGDSLDDLNDMNMSSGDEGGLLALRTVVVLGSIEVGGKTTVQVPCIAVRTGIVRLGAVRIVCDGESKLGQRVWTADADYVTIAVEAPAGKDGSVDKDVLESIVERQYKFGLYE